MRILSSGIVVTDLELPEPRICATKAGLMTRINSAVERRTDKRIVKMLDITEPQLNDLRRGRLNEFSLERLKDMLRRAVA